jgi:hypothetical protein
MSNEHDHAIPTLRCFLTDGDGNILLFESILNRGQWTCLRSELRSGWTVEQILSQSVEDATNLSSKVLRSFCFVDEVGKRQEDGGIDLFYIMLIEEGDFNLAKDYLDMVRVPYEKMLTLNIAIEVRRAALDSKACLTKNSLTWLRQRSIPPTVSDIQKIVADYYNVRHQELLSASRKREFARPRQVAMWLCKHATTRSLPDLGRRFGGRDHTTVIHAIRRIDELRLSVPYIRLDTDKLLRLFSTANSTGT